MPGDRIPSIAARTRAVVAAVALVAVVGGGALLARRHLAPHAPVVLENGKTHYGKTYAEWGTAWWKWIYETPPGPGCAIVLEDATGSLCTSGQPPDMFFLAGTSGARVTRTKCVVPNGRPIFFPVLNVEEEASAEHSKITDEQLVKQVDRLMVNTSGAFAEVDGVKLDLTKLSVPATRFSYTLPPEPNLYSCAGKHDVVGKVEPAYHEGIWVLLVPLTPGPHVLHFGGIIHAPTSDLTIDTTYRLTVE